MYLQIKTIILCEYGRRGIKYEYEGGKKKIDVIVLLDSLKAHFPPTEKSDWRNQSN